MAWKFIDQFLCNLHSFDVERESAFTIPILSASLLHQIADFLLYGFPVRIWPEYFVGAPGAACDVRYGDEAGISDLDDVDTFNVRNVRDRRLNRLIEARRFSVEISVLDLIAPAYRRVIAPCLEEPVDERVGLQIGAIDDQREMMYWHRLLLPLTIGRIHVGNV